MGKTISWKITDKFWEKRARVERKLGRSPIHYIGRYSIKPEEIPESEQKSTDLHQLFYTNNDRPIVHKWRNYLSIYEKHLGKFRQVAKLGRPLRLLEIGVSHGGSLQMWRNYFGRDAIIFGIDIDERCAGVAGEYAKVRIGSQTDEKFLTSVVAEMGGLDVVIDDGSHIASHQIASFDVLFPLLDSNGTYFCEDLHTAYWPGKFEGGYRRRSTFIEFAKNLVDDIHSDFHKKGENVPGASRSIEGIHFYNSVVVIEKREQPASAHLAIGTPQF